MNLKRLTIIITLTILFISAWYFDFFRYFSFERINQLSNWINSFGLLAPIVYILVYIVSTILFLPAIPITLLGGVIFGPLMGSIYVSIASTSGAIISFLIARNLGRDYVKQKLGNLDLFQRIDDGVSNQGWKMVAITRLVPLFPFNAQNYIYGLTSVSLTTYSIVSWVCMLPATFAYVFLSGSVVAGQGDILKTVTYLGVAVALILSMSMVSRLIVKKQKLS